MDFFQLITVRESCRNYTGEAVPREKLEAILNAARMRPQPATANRGAS